MNSGVTAGTLLNFINKKQKLSYLGHMKRPLNTGEINTRRKSERPKILGEGCGGLDGGKCLESGTNSRRSAGVRKIQRGNNVRKLISEKEIQLLQF